MIDRKSKLAIGFATILLFISLVVLIVFLIPKVSQLKLLSNQVQSKKSEYESGKLKLENIQVLNQMVGQYKKQAELLGIALPSSEKADEALLELSTASSDANLQVTSAEVNSDKKGNLTVNFSTKGTFENTVSFLGKLKTNLRPIKIAELSMTKADNEIITNYTMNFPYFTKFGQTATQNNQTSEVK